MTQLALLVDDELCFDCKACEVACKQENDVPIGLRFITVVPIMPKKIGDTVISRFVPIPCYHCARPLCIDACPTSSITKREDGIVVIDEDTCIGCRECISACPFSVIGVDPQKNTARKCTLCLHRIEKGKLPACVQACPSEAIYFGDINEVSLRIREDRIKRRK